MHEQEGGRESQAEERACEKDRKAVCLSALQCCGSRLLTALQPQEGWEKRLVNSSGVASSQCLP